MSVTFTFASHVAHPEFGAILVHGANCTHTCPVTDYVCEDFMVYRHCDHLDAAITACGCEAYDVNMSEANAAQVLDRLGLLSDDGDCGGDVTPDDLLGRALVGNVGRDDTGVQAASWGGPGTGGARMVECGLRAGYFDHRLEQLVALATEAKARGVLVGWS